MTLLHSLANATLIVSPIIVIILLATPIIDRKYLAGGRYFLWILVMIALMLPFVSVMPSPAIQINVPVELYRPEPPAPDRSIALPPGAVPPNPAYSPGIAGGGSAANAVSETPTSAPAALPRVSLPDLALTIWLSGVALSLAVHATKHMLFRRFVRRWSVPEPDIRIAAVLNDEASRMGIRKPIALNRCKGINAPMLTGIIAPTILLPDTGYDIEDLPLVFRHELTHFKRRDLLYKLALTVVKSVHWFNPAVHFMAKQADKDIETICDALTVHGIGAASRKRYSEIILRVAIGPPAYQSPLTTSMDGDKKMLKHRLSNILGVGKKKGALLFTLLGAMIVAAVLLVGANFSPDGELSEPIEYQIAAPEQSPQAAGTHMTDNREDDYTSPVPDNSWELGVRMMDESGAEYIQQTERSEQNAQGEQAEEPIAKTYGRIRTSTPVFYSSTEIYPISISHGYADYDNLPLNQGAVVEVLGPWDNGRVQVLVTSEGGPDAHNGWQSWLLWIDDSTFDTIVRKNDLDTEDSYIVGLPFFAWPVPGHHSVFAEFGFRLHPIYRIYVQRDGIGIAAPPETPIVAAESGTVVYIGESETDGLFIKLDHGAGVQTYYASLHGIAEGLAIDDTVRKGDIIGYVGSSPSDDSPHLDFRIIWNGSYINPRVIF